MVSTTVFGFVICQTLFFVLVNLLLFFSVCFCMFGYTSCGGIVSNVTTTTATTLYSPLVYYYNTTTQIVKLDEKLPAASGSFESTNTGI